MNLTPTHAYLHHTHVGSNATFGTIEGSKPPRCETDDRQPPVCPGWSVTHARECDTWEAKRKGCSRKTEGCEREREREGCERERNGYARTRERERKGCARTRGAAEGCEKRWCEGTSKTTT